MRLNKSGFTVVEVLVVLVVVAAVAGVGWFAYQRRNSDDAKQQPASITNFEECVAAGNPVMESFPEQCAANGQTFVNDSQRDTQQRSKDETADWLLYQPPGKEYSIRLADGWELERFQQDATIYARGSDSLKPQPGKRAIVQQVEGGGDGFGLWLGFVERPSNTEMRGKTLASLQTSDGLEIERFHYAPTPGSNVIGPREGSNNYYYLIQKSDNEYFEANYTHLEGEPDYRELIERVLKTVHFN